MLKSAIWWTTIACNFKCKYCWEMQAQDRGEFKPVPFRPAKDRLEVLNRVQPQLLDITGGEPFLMPDFVDLLTGLASGDPTPLLFVQTAENHIEVAMVLLIRMIASLTCHTRTLVNRTFRCHPRPPSLPGPKDDAQIAE